MTIFQEIIFTVKVEENDDATMFFIVEKQQETIINFFLNLLFVTE